MVVRESVEKGGGPFAGGAQAPAFGLQGDLSTHPDGRGVMPSSTMTEAGLARIGWRGLGGTRSLASGVLPFPWWFVDFGWLALGNQAVQS